jgi:hypothetical protein
MGLIAGRFAPDRLYEVPVRLKVRDQPLPEDEVKPLHLHI